MKAIVFFFLCLVLSPLAHSKPHGLSQILEKEEKNANPKVDMCNLCVTFMQNAINQLLQIILNGGVIGSCGALCGQLPDQLEQVACDLLCDYVGIEAFIDAINYEDPDPIYICQVLDTCPIVSGGAVTITKSTVQPPTGHTGQTFNLVLNYQVTAPTSTGLIVVTIIPPANEGFPLGDGVFEEGQPIGQYNVAWQLPATPSENEAFGGGLYQVVFQVCSGDCTTSHPYSGVYAQSVTSFTILNGTRTMQPIA